MKILYQGKKVFLSSTLKNDFLLPKSFKKLPFDKIKDDILGKKYELSIVLIGKKYAKSLNKQYRKKDGPTDILSFPLSPATGEIFICPEVAKKKSLSFFSDKLPQNKKTENYLLLLVIHGNLHLKGLAHGSKMNKYELTYYSRYRRRYL